MKKSLKILILSAAFLFVVVLILFIVFLLRSPVLIVAEQAFVDIYGAGRIRRESFFASFVLFRQVKTVIISNEAGDDVIPFAVAEISSRPYCVIFPRRFAHSAMLYHDQNPNVPAVLLEGRYFQGGDESSILFIYKTDIDSDFYRAGLVAAALLEGQNDRIAVFTEFGVQSAAREAFLRALRDQEKTAETLFFTSFSQFPQNLDFSCVVLAGAGIEFLEQDTDIPVILFTWIPPSMVPQGIIAVVNDSPWVQVSGAAKLAGEGVKNSMIPSNFQILDRNKIGRDTLQKIKNIW